MPHYAILADTDSSLPISLAEDLGIGLVPIQIQFDDGTTYNDLTMDNARLFARVDREGRIPSTAAPAPGAFQSAFEAALQGGAEGIICYCVSSAVSATYGAAVLAAESLGEADITVVDTGTLSMAQGFMVLAAAEAARQGASKQEILGAAAAVGERAALYGALSTLKYLAMGGRVPHLAAGMAGLLNIRPILSVQEGKLDLLEKVRTRQRAWSRLVALCQECVGQGQMARWALLHVNAEPEALALGELLRSEIACAAEPLLVPLNPGLAVHTGAGLVGVALVRG
jgi:DegV family protein with EDD domain